MVVALGSRALLAAVALTIVALAVGAVVMLARSAGGPRVDATAAEAVQGAVLHDRVRLENEDFAAEMLRKECERGRGVNCGSINPPPPPRAGQQTIVAFRGPLPSAEADGGEPKPSFAARNLINNAGPTTPGWRSTSASLPVEIAFELDFERQVNRVAFRQTQASPPGAWAKDVELILARFRDDPGQIAGRWTLRQTTEPQHFSFRTVQARVARIRVLSRHGAPGDADYTALGAFALGAATGDPGPLLSG
jgi:hypothetical protein